MESNETKETRNQRRARRRKEKKFVEFNMRRVAKQNHHIDRITSSSTTWGARELLRFHKMVSEWIAEHDTQHPSSTMEERRLAIRKRSRDTPYFDPLYKNRGQIIACKLYSSAQPITTVAATAYTTVIAIQASLFPLFASVATVFEEYRFIRGKVYYIPEYMAGSGTNFNAGAFAAAVDPADPSVFSSLSGPWNSDNKKTGYLLVIPGGPNQGGSGALTWDVPFDSMPDKVWIPATTTNQTTAYWKPYMPSANSPGSFRCGYVMVSVDFQFRGLG